MFKLNEDAKVDLINFKNFTRNINYPVFDHAAEALIMSDMTMPRAVARLMANL